MPDASSPETQLMESIRQKWGAAIAAACNGTMVPSSFLAALVANETGGNPTKTRFEESVFMILCSVCAGKRAHYGQLGKNDLLPPVTDYSFTDGILRLVNFSTSWGLTQIMGYNTIPFSRPLSVLADSTQHLQFAVILLVQMANRWGLDLRQDYEKLFACWNTGQPEPMKTTDPKYCANGVMRMGLYDRLVATAQAATVNG
jgi:hypothetical protein